MKKIPPFKLSPQPLNEDAAALPKFRFAGEDIGNRHKLGGEPDFIQEPDWPTCECCAQKMSFYAQLDSINDEYILADCGMIYVFACFDCYTVAAQVQSF